ncbi:hypothetical protein SLA2020_061790 [Shorea laevis]
MELKQVLSMTKGDGENSYLKASLFSQNFASMTVPSIDRVAQFPSKLIIFSLVRNPIYLNDLPSNDFNTLFKGLHQQYEDQYSWLFAATTGSFHGQLFPRNTLHVVYCCYGTRWLSRVQRIATEDGLPLNRGKIYISKTGLFEVSKAYLSQFQEDFFLFLKSRSLELVPEGLMLLVLHGWEVEDPTCRNGCYIWEILPKAIVELVKKGLIDRKFPTLVEEGSFTTEYLETVPVEVGGTNVWSIPQQKMKNLRAISEPFISSQFGEDLIHKLYEKGEEIHIANNEQGTELTHFTSIVVVPREKII